MRFLTLILSLILMPPGQADAADRVNWPHFLKINPWSFEPDEVRYPNHSNVAPSVIEELIGGAESQLSPSARMLRAAQAISALPKLAPEQRAVLMRDALDRIHERDHRWTAYDAGAINGVVFYGGEIEAKKRFALAICLKTGKIYKGEIACAALVETAMLVDFETSPSWKPVVATPSQKP